jgi:MYXO-CTERM domain-containing protein
MKNKTLHSRPASIPKKRWAAYAAAGVATALAGSNSLEAAIHYSGFLSVTFPPDRPRLKNFPLDQTGDYFVFARGKDLLSNTVPDLAAFSVFGIVSAAFRGSSPPSTYQYPVSKLPFGENISAGPFTKPRDRNFSGALASRYHSSTQWADRGIGFVGFRFNNGAGTQYGWVRVGMKGVPENAFKVLDYAYADPGEPIRAGQTSSDEQSPAQGSLGWLALGAVGLLAWRKSRSRTAS